MTSGSTGATARARPPELPSHNPAGQSSVSFGGKRLKEVLRSSGPPLIYGLRLWASVCLALYVAFWLELDNAYWAGLTAAIVCQPNVGASLRKGWFRAIGTVVGAVSVVVLTACFPQDRCLFLIAMAVWGATCAFTATVLHNFAAYAAALAGYTAAIIATDQLGATGGLNGQAFMLAVTRVSEIGIGIVCAGVIHAGTDLGGARRRLAMLFAGLATGITGQFTRTLVLAGSPLPDTGSVQRDFLRRAVSLDPIIDATLGESSELRSHSPVLQTAMDDLFTALAGWRAVANHLARLPDNEARQQSAVILGTFPLELLAAPEQAEADRWAADPSRLRRICNSAAVELSALPVDTPSLRLLADKAAEALLGISHVLNGLALLVHHPVRTLGGPRGTVRLRLPDCLPALINAGRAFVTIGAVAVFWIVTAWPNGATAMEFAAIIVILFAAQADQAYATAAGFMAGTLFAAAFAAIFLFAVLPAMRTQSFAAFSIALGLYLIPTAALATLSWHKAVFTAMTLHFVALLGPANPMTYDAAQFCNSAVAIVVGIAAGAWSFRLVPPPSPAFRARRLLALTLRDLRRLVQATAYSDWQGHVYGRLSVMPKEATPVQRAHLLAALSVGIEVIRLRHIACHVGVGAELGVALSALAHGNSRIAIAHLAQLDEVLATQGSAASAMQIALRARSSILVLTQVLTEHDAYFDGRVAA